MSSFKEQLRSLSDGDKEIFLELKQYSEDTVKAVISYTLKEFKRYRQDGPQALLSGFNLDQTILDAMNASYPKIEKKLSAVARKADRSASNILGESIGFTDNSVLAANSLYVSLLSYIQYDNQQVKSFRKFLAGDTNKLVAEKYVVPVIFARNAMAVLGGANVDPSTSQPVSDDEGNHLFGEVLALGFILTGFYALNRWRHRFEEENGPGTAPQLKYRWIHTSPPGTELPAHGNLNGVVFTKATAAQVLRNTTVPWLGPFFYIGDHFGCACFLQVFY